MKGDLYFSTPAAITRKIQREAAALGIPAQQYLGKLLEEKRKKAGERNAANAPTANRLKVSEKLKAAVKREAEVSGMSTSAYLKEIFFSTELKRWTEEAYGR